MIIRKITPEERVEAAKVQSTAFNIGSDLMTMEDPTTGYEFIRAAFNDAGKLCSCMEVIPFEASFNGMKVKMAGIGGVASLPEERGMHTIQRIFEAAFAEMRQNGQLLSYLYPFSHNYYRKYGYEHTMLRVKCTIPVKSFAQFEQTGDIRAWHPGEDDADIRRVFEDFANEHNFAIFRDDRLWQRHLGDDPYLKNTYTYVWYDKTGKSGGYLNFTAKSGEPFRSDIQVNELIWSSTEGLLGLFAFVGCFTSQYDNFYWLAPSSLNLQSLFHEPYDVRAETRPGGMSRVVDVEPLLKLLPAPAGEGRVVLKVTDSFLSWNNGTFAVDWSGGELTVSREETEPDILCTVQQLAKLISGYSSLDGCELGGGLEVGANREQTERLFPLRKLFITEAF